jgi:hypothetical protein
MNRDVDDLRRVVAEWVVREQSARERARYRRFGAELSSLKARIAARPVPPTEEELEIAMTAMLVIVGRALAGQDS